MTKSQTSKTPKIVKETVKVDTTKLYEPLEAIKLAAETAKNKFEGKIEAHFNLRKPGNFGKWKTEKKAPLLHTVLGKQSEKAEELVKKLNEIAKKVDPNQIKKLVVCATMGPGIKVDLEKLEG